MVRRIVIGLLLAVSLQLPARAARRVTVQQVDLLLEEYKGQSDGKVAAQLADMVLTERAPSARLKTCLFKAKISRRIAAIRVKPVPPRPRRGRQSPPL